VHVVPFASLMHQRNGDLIQQFICIKFCFKLGENTTGTFIKLKVAFGEQAMGRIKFLNGSPSPKAA
jgi:hypothetical protein